MSSTPDSRSVSTGGPIVGEAPAPATQDAVRTQRRRWLTRQKKASSWKPVVDAITDLVSERTDRVTVLNRYLDQADRARRTDQIGGTLLLLLGTAVVYLPLLPLLPETTEVLPDAQLQIPVVSIVFAVLTLGPLTAAVRRIANLGWSYPAARDAGALLTTGWQAMLVAGLLGTGHYLMPTAAAAPGSPRLTPALRRVFVPPPMAFQHQFSRNWFGGMLVLAGAQVPVRQTDLPSWLRSGTSRR